MILNTFCAQCGARTRLIGIEPHHTESRMEIWTFECAACGQFQTAAHALSPEPQGRINQLAERPAA